MDKNILKENKAYTKEFGVSPQNIKTEVKRIRTEKREYDDFGNFIKRRTYYQTVNV